jgi:hypothetical protein
MSDSENQISEEFAKQLLKALYKLDAPVGRLDVLASKTEDKDAKKIISEIVGEMMEITLNELMIPIYKCHPSLGRASDPSIWIKES